MTDGTLWAVDRVTFRSIITDNTYRKRRLYEGFLKTIPLLESLQPSEIAKISDALEPVLHESNDVIIEQGTSGAHFYMIESGEVRVMQTTQSGEEVELPGLKAGDYFGGNQVMYWPFSNFLKNWRFSTTLPGQPL